MKIICPLTNICMCILVKDLLNLLKPNIIFIVNTLNNIHGKVSRQLNFMHIN